MSNNTTVAIGLGAPGILSNPAHQPFLNEASSWVSAIASSVFGVYALAEAKIMEIPTEYLEQIAVPGLIVSGTALSIFLLTKWMVNTCRKRPEQAPALPPPPQVPKEKDELPSALEPAVQPLPLSPQVIRQENEAPPPLEPIQNLLREEPTQPDPVSLEELIQMEEVKSEEFGSVAGPLSSKMEVLEKHQSLEMVLTVKEVEDLIKAVQKWKQDYWGRRYVYLPNDPKFALTPTEEYKFFTKLEFKLKDLLKKGEFVINDRELMNELGEFLANWREIEPRLLESDRLEFALHSILDPKTELSKVAEDLRFTVEELVIWKVYATQQIKGLQSISEKKLTKEEIELKISMIRYYILEVREQEKAEAAAKLENKNK